MGGGYCFGCVCVSAWCVCMRECVSVCVCACVSVCVCVCTSSIPMTSSCLTLSSNSLLSICGSLAPGAERERESE